MLPGYRKKTKYIQTEGSSTGFVNMNQVYAAIRKYETDTEFYEIEPAEVVKVWLDPEEPNFPTTKINNRIVPDLHALGSVQVRLLHSQSGGGVLDKPVKPISQHIVQYPLRGEVVNVADYDGQLYYYNPLNLYGNIHQNKLPVRLSEGKVHGDYLKFYRKIEVEQGDTVIQGRFGQSLHFGSDHNYVKPYMKLTVGQGRNPALFIEKYKDPAYVHKSDINWDLASIWMTTNQHVPLATAAPSNMKAATLGGKHHSVIALNSDSIVFNAKKKDGDISAYASRNINLCAQTSINLESEYGVINLGDVIGQNPAVKGKELVEFFETLLGELDNYAGSVAAMLKSQYKVSMKEDEGAKLQVNNFTNSFTKALDKLDEKLQGSATFFSKRVFLANDHNPPAFEEDAIDKRITKSGDPALDSGLQSLWDDVSYEKIPPVVGYDTDDVEFDEDM